MSFAFKLKVLKKLRRVAKQNEDIIALLKELKMAGSQVSQDIQDLSQKIDDATNTVAAEIETLKGQIKNSMTDQEVADIKTRLGATAARLTTLGQDPNNPVPPAP